MAMNFTPVTELPGSMVTREQLARLYHRYHTAGRYAAGKRVLEVACGAGLGLGYLVRTAESVGSRW
jgi:cyclopropane fatty-acyl-phospholipid synthase-like methyltransferase